MRMNMGRPGISSMVIYLSLVTFLFLTFGHCTAKEHEAERAAHFSLHVNPDSKSAKLRCSVNGKPPVDFSQALELCKKALEFHPDMPMELQVNRKLRIEDLNYVLRKLSEIGWREIRFNGILNGTLHNIKSERGLVEE